MTEQPNTQPETDETGDEDLTTVEPVDYPDVEKQDSDEPVDGIDQDTADADS